MGDWKLVTQNNEPTALYNLASDLGETTDLASQNPDRFKQLKARFEEWNSELVDPLWKGKQRKQPATVEPPVRAARPKRKKRQQ